MACAATADTLPAATEFALVPNRPFRSSLALIAFSIEVVGCHAKPHSGAGGFAFVPNVAHQTQDAVDWHPRLGVRVGTRTILVILAEGATGADLDDLLKAIGGTLSGGDPKTGLVAITLPQGTSFDALDHARDLAESHHGIGAVCLDTELHGQNVPDEVGGMGEAGAAWSWRTAGPPDSAEGNWGLKQIFAPTAWNLNRWLEANGTQVEVSIYDAADSSRWLKGRSGLAPPGTTHRLAPAVLVRALVRCHRKGSSRS
jgi:hypothetical protein